MKLPIYKLMSFSDFRRYNRNFQPGPETLDDVIPYSELWAPLEDEAPPLIELSWDNNLLSRLEPFNIKQLFLVYEDGRLISHVSADDEGTVDNEMVSSMLTAIQDFIGDTLEGSEKGDILENVKMGEVDLYLQAADKVFIAAVVDGKTPESFLPELNSLAQEIDTEYSKKLEAWDGDVDQLAVTGFEMKEFIHYWSKPINM